MPAEIIVTATRREESILDVPISLEAYGQDELDLKGARGIEDIARITPGVTIEQGLGGAQYIAIRGLFSTVGATMTGVYIDDTPVQVRSLVLAANFYPAIFDLDRVEVLRGPQGTLFGAGAMGGAVRYILPKPSLTEYSGSARAELAFTEGGDPSYEGGVAVGGPIIQDKLGFRVSGYHRRDGGYVDRIQYVANRGTAKKNSNSKETTVLNGALTFAPFDDLTLTPSVFYQKITHDDTDLFWQFVEDNPVVARPQLPRFVNGEGIAGTGSDESALYTLKSQLDFGGASLISNTAFIDRKTRLDEDATNAYQEVLGSVAALFGLPPVYFDTPFGGLERSTIGRSWTQHSFSQELRLQSNDDAARLNYVLGLFYQNARQTSIGRNLFPQFGAWTTAIFGAPIFGVPGADNVVSADDNFTRDRQYAAFGELDYKLTDKLTASAGVRVSRMKFDFTQLRSGPFNGGTFFTEGKSAETPVTPKFALEYKPSDAWLLYASAAKGFRQGGGNNLANAVTCAPDLAALGISQIPSQYRSDSVWSYEVGAKGRAGRALSVAASLFDIEWTDIQQPRTLPTCSHVFIDNLGSARSRGFDAQITVSPAPGLSFDAGIGYMDTKFRETINTEPGGVPGTIVRKGDRFAAPWIISLAADYRAPISGGLDGYGHIQYDYRAGYNVAPGNVEYNPVTSNPEDQHYASARVGVRSGPVDVSVFVNNIFNSVDPLTKLQWTIGSDRILETTYRPRTVGATASYRF
ncbi:TonB-dependent receptor [Tsuneonella rigui]|uniref:TonB-dependent receptor n=1 Tax=Tsuneonella rigui TaxID=1708790 RepID=UPI0019D042E1|nr:TonB-dependent receptor [Tsuneonella rigui]